MARSFVSLEKGLPRLSLGERKGRTVSARVLDAGAGLAAARLWYTTREPLALRDVATNMKTEWLSAPASIAGDVVSAELPSEARIAYLSVYEDAAATRDICGSSGFFHVSR